MTPNVNTYIEQKERKNSYENNYINKTIHGYYRVKFLKVNGIVPQKPQKIKIARHNAFLGFGMKLHQGKDSQNPRTQGS